MRNSPFASLRPATLLLATGLGLALLLLVAPTLYSHLLLNVAQVRRLHGESRPEDYARALAAAPGDAHTRWQAGVALADAGNPAAASDLLMPLAQEPGRHPDAARLLLAALVDAGRADEALQTYMAWEAPPALPSRTAAALVLTSLDSDVALDAARLRSLLAQALTFAPSAPELELLTEQMADQAEFWGGPIGARVRDTLRWRASWRGTPLNADGAAHGASDLMGQAAALVGLAPEQVSVGMELVDNGGFERDAACEPRFIQPCAPASWELSLMTTGNPWNRAAFVVARDTAPGGDDVSLRIDGLAIERLATREAARAGLISVEPIVVAAGHPYLISFRYRTEQASDNAASIWLSADPAVLFAGDRWFAATGGQWRRVIIIAWNRSGHEATVQPILRSWSEGSVWFDDLSIRQLLPGVPVPARDAVIQIDGP